jgi:hypothetical protein
MLPLLSVAGCYETAVGVGQTVNAMQERDDRRAEAEQNHADETRRQHENAEIRDTGKRLELERRMAGSGSDFVMDGETGRAPVPPTCVERRRATMQRAQQLDDPDQRTQLLANLPKCDELPESLDRDMIVAGIAGVKVRVSSCREKSAAKGTVKVRIVVGSDGRVADVLVNSTPDVELGLCVVRELRLAAFAETRKGGTFDYPFVF